MVKKNAGDVEKVMKLVKDEDVKMVNFKFMDFPGMWQQFSVPIHRGYFRRRTRFRRVEYSGMENHPRE
jgi:glutamine synthetase